MKNYLKATSINVDTAIQLLNKKEIIIHSTDTLPGLAVDATSTEAIQKLIKLKGRGGPYSIIIKSIDEIQNYAILTKALVDKIKKILPGPFTILLKNNQNNNLSKLALGESDLIGFRIPNHKFTNQLVAKFGKPIITTSVNITGEGSILNLKTVSNHFKEIVIFDDEIRNASKGSTILNFSSSEFKIIRQGDGDYLL